MIVIKDLHKNFGNRKVLTGVNLIVPRNEVLAIIGPSGSGKTTLLQILDTLVKPTSGTVLFDGIDISKSERERCQVRRRMAMVFQKPVVFRESVFANVAYGLKVRGMKRSDVSEKVLKALGTVGLLDYEKRNAKTLSGGEAQRVALARAMVIEPELLLLDEPTANLDMVSTRQFEEYLVRVINELHTTVIFSTHDLAQGTRLADRMGVLIDGELLQTGVAEDVMNEPASGRVAEFINAVQSFPEDRSGYGT